MPKLKNLIWSLALIICLCLLGCGGQPTKETPSPAPAPPPAEKVPAPGTPEGAEKPAAHAEPAAPTETPAKEASPEPAQTKKPGTKPGADTGALKPVPSKPKGPAPELFEPSLAKAVAPAQYKVRFETTKGDFVIQVTRAWAPLGADRFYNLVKAGYFTDVAFFRVLDGFMAQFGINGDPKVNEKWEPSRIQDDPVKESNVRGMISFATAGPGTRTTQLFINFGDNSKLDTMGFSPFGKVIEGMSVVDALYKDYGEGYPNGRGPSQGRVQSEGNQYLKKEFPKLDYIKQATFVK
jgi:peptidyl-prolyl cis-trans isomerase A (cyclophilin A)